MTPGRFSPLAPDLLAARLAEYLAARSTGQHPLRVALDAPSCADLADLVARVERNLRAFGTPVASVAAADFYRDASLRFEYGHTDVESFYSGWLDTAALQREVLQPLAARSEYLPSLRDPTTNRATRATPVRLDPRGALLLSGELLLGIGLSIDVAVHFSVSRQARRRLTPETLQWTLPAFDRYDADVDPSAIADVVVRYDDPARPAARWPVS